MMIQILRYFLWIFLFLIIFLTYNAWESEKKILDVIRSSENKMVVNKNLNIDLGSISSYLSNNLNEIHIDTNLISAKLDLNSGNISYIALKKYNIELNNNSNKIVLLDFNNKNINSILTGFYLKNNDFSDTIMNFKITNYFIEEKDNSIILKFDYKLNEFINIVKIYTFKSFTYDINLDYFIINNSNSDLLSNFYGIINYVKVNDEKKSFFLANSNYSDIACYSLKKPYTKLFSDNSFKKNLIFIENGGWISYLDRYFLSSWIPDLKYSYNYSFYKINDGNYALKCFSKDEIIKSYSCFKFESKLYFGPKLKNNLVRLHDGLDLSIDYGIFWPIATPMFLLLGKIYNILNNWGLSIIFITLMVKILFFHLSSYSYNSMSKMKILQPRLDLLKDRYKDDRKMFGQAVLDLYKKEKVNPLSGCLPIIIQIPFFIALYYVLLESVELRHADFYFWIKDLSSKDPYYIFPVIMTLTILIQQKLSPSIQDRSQRFIMNLLPFIFLIFFLQFPSGLILYWIINNILSILQQILINNRII